MAPPSLMELVAIKDSPRLTISRTPFPAGIEITYVKRAVPWKGAKGPAFEEIARKHKRLLEGINAAKALSKRHREVGVAAVEYLPGSKRPRFLGVIPLKCARMMVEQGTGRIVDEAMSAWELMLRVPELRARIGAAAIAPVAVTP